MKLLREIHNKETGQAFILALILLLVGGLIIAPLLAFMSTGLVAGRTYEQKMDEVYACDAGIEDAILNLITPGAPYYQDLQDLEDGESLDPYPLTDPINGETVYVTVTKLSLVQGLLGEDEYKMGQPHQDWVYPDITPPPEPGGVYNCTVSFNYLEEYGNGNRRIESVGIYFSPLPNKGADQEYEEIIGVPNEYGWSGVFEENHFNTPPLEEDSDPQIKIASSGFAYIWRWENNQGPLLDPQHGYRLGEFSFDFQISDPGWDYGLYFVWATFKEQDISYITSAEFYKLLIEATAGDTIVQSVVLENMGDLTILTWEINPPQDE